MTALVRQYLIDGGSVSARNMASAAVSAVDRTADYYSQFIGEIIFTWSFLKMMRQTYFSRLLWKMAMEIKKALGFLISVTAYFYLSLIIEGQKMFSRFYIILRKIAIENVDYYEYQEVIRSIRISVTNLYKRVG